MNHNTGEPFNADVDSLAALLAKTVEEARLPVAAWKETRLIADKARADTLAEVRRVVEEVRDAARTRGPYWDCGCDEILRRLEGK